MSNRLLQRIFYLRRVGAILMAGLIAATLVPTADTTLEAAEAEKAEATEQERGIPRWNNPGSIVNRLRRDSVERQDYLFQLPGVDRLLKPWFELKANLDENYGIRYGISYSVHYQKASDTFGSKDEAFSYDLDFIGTWTPIGRGTGTRTMFGFEFLKRDNMGTDLTPQTLFTQFGSLYSTAAAYGETEASIGELWIQQRFKNVFGFRLGQIFPITAYDFFPFKNFRKDFVDFNHVTNAAIPLPSNGLGAFAVYKPDPRLMLRLGAHDANAETEKEFGFNTFEEGELFKIFEVVYDTGFIPREPGRAPHGHIHVSTWHQNQREDEGISSGWGIAGSALQRFGRFTPWVRYGYANHNDDGPTPVKHMANVGLAINGIFGQSYDRIGIGFTWSDPANHDLDDQSQIDMYYRVQVTPEIQFSPTFQAIFDPSRNPEEDTVYVWGIRARFAL